MEESTSSTYPNEQQHQLYPESKRRKTDDPGVVVKLEAQQCDDAAAVVETPPSNANLLSSNDPKLDTHELSYHTDEERRDKDDGVKDDDIEVLNPPPKPVVPQSTRIHGNDDENDKENDEVELYGCTNQTR
jgi:hypothetical protein